MIVLTAEQADMVRGESSPGFALVPIILADGQTFVLPERVLGLPEHTVHHDFLSSLPVREVFPHEYPQGEEE